MSAQGRKGSNKNSFSGTSIYLVILSFWAPQGLVSNSLNILPDFLSCLLVWEAQQACSFTHGLPGEQSHQSHWRPWTVFPGLCYVLTRPMAGGGPCVCQAAVWTLAITAVSDCRRCSFLFWAAGNSPCWGGGVDGDNIVSTLVLVLLTTLLFGLLHRYCVGKRSLAGWTAWPTSAHASPSSRAASPRNGWPQQPCRATSALASTRRNKGTQRMRSPPPPLQPPQPQAHHEPVDIRGSEPPSLPPDNIPALLFYLFLTVSHTLVCLFNRQHGEGRPFLLQSLFQGLPLQLLGKMTVNPNTELRIVVTKTVFSSRGLHDPWCTENCWLSQAWEHVYGQSAHTVMFLLWNCFIFLSLPLPIEAQQSLLCFGWVFPSPMIDHLPTSSEGTRARTQPSHLLDQQQTPLRSTPFVITRFLTHVKDKWKVLLFYNHLFSVLKFKSLNDCPALENNNKEPRKWICYCGFSLGSKRAWGYGG